LIATAETRPSTTERITLPESQMGPGFLLRVSLGYPAAGVRAQLASARDTRAGGDPI